MHRDFPPFSATFSRHPRFTASKIVSMPNRNGMRTLCGAKSGSPRENLRFFSWGKNRGPRKVPQCNEDTLWGKKNAPLTQGVCAGRFFVDLSRGLISHSPTASASPLSATPIMCPVNSPLSVDESLYFPSSIFPINVLTSQCGSAIPYVNS